MVRGLGAVRWSYWPIVLIGMALVPPAAVAQQQQADRNETREGPEGESSGSQGDSASSSSSEQSGAGQSGSSASGSGASQASGSGSSGGQASAKGRAEMPWAGTADVPLPAFLKTEDKRIEDERPPPSEAQVEALKEMEAEVDRFSRIAGSYKTTVNSLLRREYRRQRRSRNQWYSRQIEQEEELLDESRQRAIRLFERFIRRYPNDPTYTPDAMFRLGELYFERDSIKFQEAYSKARETGEEAPLQPDYTATIELYRDLVRKFPDYRRADGVYYLIGYTLNEMAKPKEARKAWLNLVCANEYDYDPDEALDEVEDSKEEKSKSEKAQEEFEEEHPAANLDQEEEQSDGEGEGTFKDPYKDCEPVTPDARFVSETWFRIGEYHFDDYGTPHSLDLAIAAYKKILEDPEDRNYNLALYKIAWAYYRDNRYPEAIEHFGKLVEWSDEKRKETGKAGSELRPEAIQYMGIALAYDDWNENLTPDAQEGLPTPLERVQDPELLPQDRSWTAEVYFQLGQVLYDQAKYKQAIKVWELALDKWPKHHRAPEITNMIARAHQEQKNFEKAISMRAKLGDYTEGSEWAEKNKDKPKELREAEELAENALIGTAIHYHQQAQQLRRQCVAQQDLSLCDKAQENYQLAADGYRKYLDNYPNNPQAYELQYNLADALYWSENYEKASRQYAAVRDSNLSDKHLVEAARRVVDSLKQMVKQAKKDGELTVREDPPEPQGDPPKVTPIEMPKLLQRLAQARETYLDRVSEERDTENVREAYDYNNALLLYKYGYWAHAKKRFERIFDERCKGNNADDTGRVAWLNLRNIAVSLDQLEEVERLSTELRERQCTFGSGEEGGAAPSADCESPELKKYCEKEENKHDPKCLSCGDLQNICYRRAIEQTYRPAQEAQGERQRRLYEAAATKLVRCVNQAPEHKDAPIALEMAATALEETSRFESAAKLYQRIIDEVGPMEAESPEEEKRLDSILANAYFRLAYNANRFFDFERAVENYRLLADSKRFGDSESDQIQKWREDALINAAIILENLQKYDRASDYYERAADMVDDAATKRKANYRMAEVAYKQDNYRQAIDLMEEFIRKYEGDEEAGDLVVQAYWRIAQIREKTRSKRRYRGALEDVVQAFEQSGQDPGSVAAEYAARAAFTLADNEEVEEFEDFKIEPGQPPTMDAYVKTITSQIEEGSKKAKDLAAQFDDVPGYRRPTWTIASFVRQGRIYEVLARAVLETKFVMPRDMKRKLRGLNPMERDKIRFQVEDKVRQVLDKKVRPIECLAVVRYSLAARAARAGAIDNEHTRSAVDRLQAYGDQRIAECIEERRKEDSSLKPYQSGEFSRAPRGQSREPEADVAPPPLAGAQ